MRPMISPGTRILATSAVAGLALTTFLQGSTGIDHEPHGLRGVTYANTALAGSALLYFAYMWARHDSVGRVATILAAGGAMGVLLALGCEVAGTAAAGPGLFESTALLSAVAVLAYLAMERAYRDRSAGVVVMAAVMASILCEMWLITKGFAAGGRPEGGLGAYWAEGHRFAFCLGYLALAAAAALGVLPISRHRASPAKRPLAIHGALAAGMALLVLGAGMGAVWCIVARGSAPWGELQVAASWLTVTLALAAWASMRGIRDPHPGPLAMCVFAVATAGLLVPMLIARSVA